MRGLFLFSPLTPTGKANLRSLLRLCLLQAIGSVALRAADPLASIFAPLTTDTAALSPDGKRLAYSFREGDKISILTLEVASPARANCVVAVAKDDYALGYMQRDFHNHPSRITWLGWTSPNRVIVESNLVFLSTRNDRRGVVFGFDHDGANARIIHSAREAMGPVHVYGLLRERGSALLVKSDREWSLLDGENGTTHTLDRQEFADIVTALQVQQERAIVEQPGILSQLATLFPGREIMLLPHFGPSPRVLARVTSCADPGSFVVFDPATRKAWDTVRRAPARESIRSHRLEPFDFTDEKGARFSGALMLPLNPRMKKAPLILWLPTNLGARVRRDYHPEVEALAALGFAVAVVDGLAWRSAPDGDPSELHRFPDLPFSFEKNSARPPAPPSFDADPMREIEHQLRACELLAQKFPVSRRALALFGEGRSGQLALNAAISLPGQVRCVVALEPSPNRLRRLGDFDPLSAVRKLSSAPIGAAFVRSARYVPHAGGRRQEFAAFTITKDLAFALERKAVVSDFAAVDLPYSAMNADARAALFRDLEKFLNAHLYRYSVELGEVDVVGTDVPLPPR